MTRKMGSGVVRCFLWVRRFLFGLLQLDLEEGPRLSSKVEPETITTNWVKPIALPPTQLKLQYTIKPISSYSSSYLKNSAHPPTP